MTTKLTLSLEAHIESILFFKAEPVSVSMLAKIFNVTTDDVEMALQQLQENLEHRGIVVVRNGTDVMLETAPESATFIESIIKEDISRDIGKAGLEVLAIVLYRGPIAKSDIDYVRGVNSSFILRNLMVRGLVEREVGESGRTSFLYKPSFELLSHLGIQNISELPEFEKVVSELENFQKEKHEHNEQ